MGALLNYILVSPALSMLGMTSLAWLIGLVLGFLLPRSDPSRRSRGWREVVPHNGPSALDAHYREWHAYQVRERHRPTTS